MNSTANPPTESSNLKQAPPFAKGGLGGISPIFVLAHKELFTLFNSPATYIVCVLFLVISGWLFAVPLFQANQSNLDTFARPLPLIFTFLIPALTMRSFSEEFKSGTIEYLATL